MPTEVGKDFKVFDKSDGILILQLNSTASNHGGVHHVQVQSQPPLGCLLRLLLLRLHFDSHNIVPLHLPLLDAAPSVAVATKVQAFGMVG